MLMMRDLWGPPWRRKKPRKKEPFTGGILLRRRPEASKAIPGTTRAKRSAFARSFGDLALPDFMATASAADPLEANAQAAQTLSLRLPPPPLLLLNCGR